MKNPHDLTRTPLGSSGGSGIAVAAAFPVVGIGTDKGGSIRNPSAATGIVGLKPTRGLMFGAGNLASAYRNRRPCGFFEWRYALGRPLSSTIVRTRQFSARTVEKNAEDSPKRVQKQVHGPIRLSFPSFDSAPNVFSQAQKAFGDLLLSIRLAVSQRSAQMSVQSRPFALCDSHSSGL